MVSVFLLSIHENIQGFSNSGNNNFHRKEDLLIQEEKNKTLHFYLRGGIRMMLKEKLKSTKFVLFDCFKGIVPK